MTRRADDLDRQAEAEQMAAAVAVGVKQGLKEILADPVLMEVVWEQAYVALSRRARDGSAQWIGGKILTAIATAVLGLCLAYLVRTGKI